MMHCWDIVMIAAMIMGAALAAVIYNLKRSHPTRNVPLIDYEMALLFQPMMILGISIGVAFNIIFPDWLITLLLVLLCTSTHSIPNKSFLCIDEVCPEKSWLHPGRP
jgi:uncharacterized membrane protein YfcA